MKKVIVLSLGVIFLTVLSYSCKKECTCKTYIEDNESNVIIVSYKGSSSCSDLNVTTMEGDGTVYEERITKVECN